MAACGCSSRRIGNLAPKLDALAAKHVYGSALFDVTTGLVGANLVSPGDNDLTRTNGGAFHTATGFDLASGFGGPWAIQTVFIPPSLSRTSSDVNVAV